MHVGSHTHTHPILAQCDATRQEQELRVSRQLLEDRFGRAELFAYPNGTAADFTPTTVHLAKRAGYRCALSTVAGLNVPRADLYALKRVNVGADMSFSAFEVAMTGL